MASNKTRAAEPFAPRNLWLAGIGLASLTRRQAIRASHEVIGGACRLRGDAGSLASDALAIAHGLALTVKERLGPVVLGVEQRFAGAVGKVDAKAGSALRRGAKRPRKVPAAAKRAVRRTATAGQG